MHASVCVHIYIMDTVHTHSHTLLIMQLNRALGGFKTFYAWWKGHKFSNLHTQIPQLLVRMCFMLNVCARRTKRVAINLC